MAEEIESEKMTEIIGYLSMEKASKIKGWQDYEKASAALSKARQEAEKTKRVIRDEIRRTLGINVPMDFTVEIGRIRVFKAKKKILKPGTRNLDDAFHPQ